MRSCLVIGAGMAGLAAGRVLHEAGWQVTLLDKGRVAGGRMATRTFDDGRFDYGAQFFTFRDDAFAELAGPWVTAGLALPWSGHRYRAPGGMRSLAAEMAAGLDVRQSVRIGRVEAVEGGWAAVSEAGGRFAAERLLLTAPVPQSVEMLSAGAVELDEVDWALLDRAKYWKCLTVLARLEGASTLGVTGFAAPEDGVLAWVSDNFVKGVSPVPGCLTIHASREFSEANWESPAEGVAQRLLNAAAPFFGSGVRSHYLHRWRYAEPAMQMPELFHGVGGLAFAGDIFGGPRVGGAVCSGLAAASYLLNS